MSLYIYIYVHIIIYLYMSTLYTVVYKVDICWTCSDVFLYLHDFI